jgi:hypothetical protein
LSLRTKSKEPHPLTDKEIVVRYFRCMGSKDLEGMLELFDHDAIVYEPFSKEEALYGLSAIEPFLKVAMMANSELRRTVKIERPENPGNNHNTIVALVSFEKGEKLKGRFTFEFTDNYKNNNTNVYKGKKIKSLHIEFH